MLKDKKGKVFRDTNPFQGYFGNKYQKQQGDRQEWDDLLLCETKLQVSSFQLDPKQKRPGSGVGSGHAHSAILLVFDLGRLRD